MTKTNERKDKLLLDALFSEFSISNLGKKKECIKHFYITYGPPGSGKGSVMRQIMRSDLLASDSVVSVDVDAYVAFVAKQEGVELTPGNYASLRYPTAEKFSDDIMWNYIKQYMNIIWETTGNTMEWTIRTINLLKKRNPHYRITVVYPLVNSETLVLRTQKRQAETGQAAAPAERILKNVQNASNNLQKILPLVDRIYIINNETKPSASGKRKILIKVLIFEDIKGDKRIKFEKDGVEFDCRCNNVQEMLDKFDKTLQELLLSYCKTCP